MEMRQDPLTGRWVLVAHGRASRPHDYVGGRQASRSQSCAFCPGNEWQTPPSLATYFAIGGSDKFALSPSTGKDDAVGAETMDPHDWRVRVVPNKFPAVKPIASGGLSALKSRSDPGRLGGEDPIIAEESEEDLVNCRRLPALGRHEVIIESPRHVSRLTELTDEELQLTMVAYRDRIRSARRAPGIRYAQIFKNAGPLAGASLEHAHSQLIALPLVPAGLERELARSETFFGRHQRCLLCEVIDAQRKSGAMVVAESDGLVAWCPPAARFPYEVWLAPVSHQPSFDEASPSQLSALAHLLRKVLSRLDARLDCPDYNYFLHTTPFDTNWQDHYHWHWEIMPRLTTSAGFEWASDVWINPIAPEQAAKELQSDR